VTPPPPRSFSLFFVIVAKLLRPGICLLSQSDSQCQLNRNINGVVVIRRYPPPSPLLLSVVAILLDMLIYAILQRELK
jgi:hypothetical protein